MTGPRSWPPPGPELDPEPNPGAGCVHSPAWSARMDELDRLQMDAQHQDALAENQARARAAQAQEPEAGL